MIFQHTGFMFGFSLVGALFLATAFAHDGNDFFVGLAVPTLFVFGKTLRQTDLPSE